MNFILRALADQQAGVVMREQARQSGYSDGEIDRLVRRKEWVAIRRGAYVERTRLEQMSAADKHRALVHAVVRSLEVPAVVSHTSAVVLRGLPTWGLDLSEVHVSRADLHSSRKEAGVNHHSGDIRKEDVDQVDGINVMSVPRTVIDTARITPFEPAVCVADAAFHLNPGAQEATLTRLDDMRDWQGSINAGAVTAFANGDSESVGESRSRVAFYLVAIPMPELQAEIRTESGLFVARTDFLWRERRTVGEFDGKQKFSLYLRPGERPEDVLWREKQREDAIRALGYEVIRITWADLQDPEALARRIWAAFRRAGSRWAA